MHKTVNIKYPDLQWMLWHCVVSHITTGVHSCCAKRFLKFVKYVHIHRTVCSNQTSAYSSQKCEQNYLTTKTWLKIRWVRILSCPPFELLYLTSTVYRQGNVFSFLFLVCKGAVCCASVKWDTSSRLQPLMLALFSSYFPDPQGFVSDTLRTQWTWKPEKTISVIQTLVL